MVNIPDQLVWELVKNNSSFLMKKNGHSKRSGAIEFSTEKGNVKSLNLLKYSGIANSKTIDVISTVKGGTGDDAKTKTRAQLITKTASKCHSQPSKTLVATNVNKDFRRSESVILKQTINNYYRRDLKAAVLGKYTKVYQANRRAKGITKPVACKKGRGTLSKK
jgi:large subunit ribosomal protein L28e